MFRMVFVFYLPFCFIWVVFVTPLCFIPVCLFCCCFFGVMTICNAVMLTGLEAAVGGWSLLARAVRCPAVCRHDPVETQCQQPEVLSTTASLLSPQLVRQAIYRGFPTRMVYLYYISCLRYTILVGNPQYIAHFNQWWEQRWCHGQLMQQWIWFFVFAYFKKSWRLSTNTKNHNNFFPLNLCNQWCSSS